MAHTQAESRDVVATARSELVRVLAPPEAEMVVAHVLAHGSRHTVRFEQRYRGLPVLGASAAVRVGAPGERGQVMARVYPVAPLSTRAQWTASEAESMARAHRRGWVDGPRRPWLAVLPERRAARLVWVVDGAAPRGGWRALVDAHTGEVVGEQRIALEAIGRVYPISPAVTPGLEDKELSALAAGDPIHLTSLDGQLAVANFVAYGVMPGVVFLDQSLAPSSGEDFLYDPPEDPADTHDALAQVNAYYHVARAKEYFGSVLGLDMSGPAWKLVVATNVLEHGELFDGAYYSSAGVGSPWDAPNLLGAGQGAAADFAYDSDVFLHEFTHYVNHNAVGFDAGPFAVDDWGWSPFSIAIDEGVADYFACTVNDGPIVGESSLIPIGKARDLSDTSKRCPDDVVGEGHEDGKLIGSFAWSLRERFGSAIADQLVWEAVAMLPYGASFGDLVEGIRAAAQALVHDGVLTAGEMAELDDIIRSRGLDDCGREVQLSEDSPRTMLMFGLDALADAYDTTCDQLKTIDGSIPGIFQFAARGSDGATGMKIRVELTPARAGALEWGVYVKAAEHVGFERGNPMPVPATYDDARTGIQEESTEIVIDGTSTPPFDPGTTYHLALTHRNCPGATVKVTLQSLGAGVDPDGGAEAGAESARGVGDAGCSCRGSGWGASRGTWIGVVLLLGVMGCAARRTRKGE